MINMTTYLVIHLSAIIVLLGYTFYAFAAPQETRRRVLAITGIAALVVIVTGFGMLHRLRLGTPAWALVKFGCLLGLAAISGIAYRRRAQADAFMLIALALAVTAVVMVYVRPF
jgi:hypothetical protein